MSSINLTGTLLNSIGEVDVGAVITWTHLSNTGETIATTKSDTIIPPDGSYNINLEYGRIRVDYRTENTERFVAEVVVNDASTATTIPELLNAFVPDGDGQGPAPFLMEDATDAALNFSSALDPEGYRFDIGESTTVGEINIHSGGWWFSNKTDADGKIVPFDAINGLDIDVYYDNDAPFRIVAVEALDAGTIRWSWAGLYPASAVNTVKFIPIGAGFADLVDGDAWVRDGGEFMPKQVVLKSSIQPSISNSVGGDEQTKINEILVAMRLFGVIET